MITSGQSNHSIRASFLSACLAFSLFLSSAMAADLSAPSEARQAGKPTCAVLTFDAKAGIAKDEAEILTERFTIEFGKLEKYQLINRSKMKEVLEMQKFARSDNCSATVAPENCNGSNTIADLDLENFQPVNS